ncbi:MAG: hypothetical protein IJ091_03080 [Oscillospiraceae bacterium]|nr:hypothetical protein [Oscillospiraceae bacterium]
MARTREKTGRTKTQKERVDRIKRRKRRARQVRGFLFTLFAVIGVVFVVSTAVSAIQTRLNPADDIDAYTQLISPLVGLNPIPFETIDEADKNVLVESAIWAVLQKEDTEKYTKNEFEQMMIPSVEVDRYFTKMYGEDNLPKHGNVVDADLTFVYDAESDTYIIPVTSLIGNSIPQITEIQRDGRKRLLTVAYMQYDQSIVIDPTADTTESLVFVKNMVYELTRDGDEYHITAVRNFEEPVEPSEG